MKEVLDSIQCQPILITRIFLRTVSSVNLGCEDRKGFEYIYNTRSYSKEKETIPIYEEILPKNLQKFNDSYIKIEPPT